MNNAITRRFICVEMESLVPSEFDFWMTENLQNSQRMKLTTVEATSDLFDVIFIKSFFQFFSETKEKRLRFPTEEKSKLESQFTFGNIFK